MVARDTVADYRRDCGVRCLLGSVGFLIKHGVMALHHWTIQGPRHAFAYMGRWCGGHLVGQASLLVSKLTCRGNGLISRCGHVEQHLTQMGATGNPTNLSVNGFAPTCTQFAANQFVHTLGGLVAFWVRNVDHVCEHLVYGELVVNREANVQAVNGLSRFTGALAGNDKVVGFDVGECSFNVPQAVFPFKA